MTLTESVADWLTGGALTRARDERDSARRTVRLLSGQVGADVPMTDHIEVVQLLGAVLSRFREPVPGAQTVANAPPATVAHWRARQREVAVRLRDDRQLAHHGERQRAAVARVGDEMSRAIRRWSPEVAEQREGADRG